MVHTLKISQSAPVPPSSEVLRPARGRARAGYGRIARINYSAVFILNLVLVETKFRHGRTFFAAWHVYMLEAKCSNDGLPQALNNKIERQQPALTIL